MQGVNIPLNITGNADQKLEDIGRVTPQATKAIEEFEREIEKTRKTLSRGTVQMGDFGKSFKSLGGSASHAGALLWQTKSQVDKLTSSVGKVESRSIGMGDAFKAIGRRENRSALQNTAWQLQDIVVQLEMGVPLTRTLAQQLPQIAGGFGPIAASAGVAIGLLFAFGPAFLQMASNAEDAGDAMENLKTAVEELADIESAYTDVIEGQEQAYKNADNAAANYFERRREAALEELNEANRRALEGITGFRAGRFDTTQALPGPGLKASGVPAMLAMDAAESGASGLTDAQSIVAAKMVKDFRDTEVKSLDDLSDRYSKLEDQLDDMGMSHEAIVDTFGEYLEQMGMADLLSDQLGDSVEARKDAEEAFADAAERSRKIEEQWAKEAEKRLKTAEKLASQADALAEKSEREIRLAEASVRYGKESFEYKRLKAETDREALEAQLVAKGHEEATVNALVEQLRQKQLILGQTGAYEGLMALVERQAWSIKDAFDSTSLGHLIGEVQTLAANLPGLAGALWGSLKRRTDKLSLEPFGGKGDEIYDTPSTIWGAWPEAKTKKTRGGGGGRTEKTIEEKIRDFWLEQDQVIEQQERMIGNYGKQRDILEQRADMEEDLFDIQGKLTEKDKERIAILAEQIVMIEERDAKEQRMYETINDSIEDFLTDSVKNIDNIEDAFLGMLGSVLEEIWRQQVAGPIASGIADWLFSADGNAFNRSGVTPFASGGVVGSATLFSYGGGRTGVMGEAGPEAIMPLKRGKDGKLGVAAEGGSDGMTVIQNFNFQANGDESVKRIIQQSIPQIAQAGAQQVIHMRKTGQLKGVF